MQLGTNLFTLRTPTALDPYKHLFRWMSTLRCSPYSPNREIDIESHYDEELDAQQGPD